MKGKRRIGKYLVFISHSARDTWVAKQIAESVEAVGAASFLDEVAIEVGTEFEREILRSLRKADELVVLLTPWALERPYVWAELGAAWSKGIPIVGLLHGLTSGELQARPGVPVFLKQRNLVDLNDVEKYFRQLAGRVQKRDK
ncbi:MAG TPA: toll/interleukin-1 receptor domain-containing protein [Verrucomicrobiae bacterium]|nr:toll/interleukin-1 receptor domain-containing protein [Verrucomicrobiae bacterium]